MKNFWPLLLVLISFNSIGSQVINAQTTSPKEAQANCPASLDPVPMTPYGFSMATLKSLWYSRTAVVDGMAEINAAQNADSPLTFITGMMRGLKLGNNDFICAKRAVQPFTSAAALRSLTPDQREYVTLAATSLIDVYDKKIALNARLLQFLKKFPSYGNIGELSDQLSTMQVESGQVWSDLITPVVVSLMMLVDRRPTDENGNFIKTSDPNIGHTKRSVVTMAQKHTLLGWLNEHFSEFRDGTPEDKISDPAKTAKLYLDFFDGHLCSDEPATPAGNSTVGNQE